MLASSFTFLHIRGIPIGAHWSWLLVFGLIVWSLTTYLFPLTYPELRGGSYLIMGIVATVIFFASLLLHELGHTFQAIKEGMSIDGITLWLFGGVAKFRGMFPTAGAEFRIAIAGPVVSVLLAAGFWGITFLGNNLSWPNEIVGVSDYLARINGILVAFNMVPALPLDGGRVLRAWLWHRQGNFGSATRSAATAGKAFGFVLIGIGVLGLFTGGSMGGIWLAFLGLFLLQAAQAEEAYALMRQAFAGLTVRDLMTPDPVVVPPHVTLSQFLEEFVGARGHSTYPVVDDFGLRGLISLRRAGSVPPNERSLRTVGDTMLEPPEAPVVDPDKPMLEALEILREGPGRAAVVDGGRLVGIVSVSDLARAVELQKMRGVKPSPRRRSTWFIWILVALFIGGAGGALYHPPVVVLQPGPAIDISKDVTISGIEVDAIEGEYLLTSVMFEQPNTVETVFAIFHPDRDVFPIGRLLPEGAEIEDYVEQQRMVYRESQELAAAAAAQVVGIPVEIHGTGVRVLGVADNSPADGKLQSGDVITAVNDQPIRLESELRRAVQARPPGTTFLLRVLRRGQEIEVEVSSARLPQGGETPVIGIVIQTENLEVDLPFEVTFAERDIAGPSAGLAYALVIADLLDEGDFARGRIIAATGQIDVSGHVSPVGGLNLKAIAARNNGAVLFLLPVGEVDRVSIRDLELRGVSTLQEAIDLLKGRR